MQRKRQTPIRRRQQVVRKEREQARAESKAREKENQKKGANKKGGDMLGNKNRKKGKRAQAQRVVPAQLYRDVETQSGAIALAGRELFDTPRAARSVGAAIPARTPAIVVMLGLGTAARHLLSAGRWRLSRHTASVAAAWPGMVTPASRRAKDNVTPSPLDVGSETPTRLSGETDSDEPAPPVPRVLSFIVVKRDSPRFRDHYGHWWFEMDGTESYGWWADHCPFTLRDMIVGTRGALNGMGGTCYGGTPTTDPRHGERADHEFSPTLVVPKSDRQVRDEIGAFARSYSGAWGWQWWWSKERMTDCHTFQDDLFEAIGLAEGPDHVYTRGPGCPFMYPLRHAAWRLQDALAALRSWPHGRCRRRSVDKFN